MNAANCMLVAAGLDWLEGLLPVVFVLIWIISQVMNLFRGAAKKAAAAPAPPVPRGVGRAAGEPEAQLEAEIEEFLRRSLERPTKPRTAVAEGKPPRQRRPATPAPPPLPARRPAAGGQRADRGDGDIAGHVASAFAHDLAHESPDRMGVATPTAADPSTATELVAALRGPGGLRQLILMREVLERPTHRW